MNTYHLKIVFYSFTNSDIVILQRNFRRPSSSAGMGSSGDDFFSRFINSFGGGSRGPPQPARGSSGFGGRQSEDFAPELMGLDPLSEEYQRRLENRIMQKNIDENASMAQEYNPELYSHITMLYIEWTINSFEIQAFVDSGAQSTIMSQKWAEKCNLMRLLDKRFQGIAQGVGTSKILGRIHAAQIQIGNVFFTTAITVLEDNKIDMLFGLDNLKRHRWCIDLANNQLTLNNGEVSVPFLSESEIQRDYIEEAKESLMEVDNKSQSEDEKVQELMLMGYDESVCRRALRQAKGNLQLAATILGNM